MSLRADYDRLHEKLYEAKQRTSEAKIRYDEMLDKQEAIERELNAVGDALDRAVAVAGQPPIVAAPPENLPEGITPSIGETVFALPRDGSDIGADELREKLGLSQGGLNARIQKAKRRGLIESAAWGRYRLTSDGKRMVLNLRAVPSTGS